MIRYRYNSQKQPPAPFVLVTVGNPLTGAELRDVPAQIDTGADCTLVPSGVVATLGLNYSGSWSVAGVGSKVEEMRLYPASIAIHQLPPQPIEVVAHPGESWVLLGRDVLNGFRLLLDGPGLVLEIG